MSVQTVARPVSPDTGAAALALREAIFDALCRDAALTILLGAGTKIFLGEPLIHPFPRIEIGAAKLIDFDGSDVEEHEITLHAYTRGDHRGAHMLAGALLQALDDVPLTIPGHRLVNFRFAVADIRREADGRTYHALVRFRAVTEPAEVVS